MLGSISISAHAQVYSRSAAVAYSDKWCGISSLCGEDDRFNIWSNLQSRESTYFNDYSLGFSGQGGDCANFVSQTLIWGGLESSLRAHITSGRINQNLAGNKFAGGNEVECADQAMRDAGLKCGGVLGTWASAGSDQPEIPLRDFLIQVFHAQYLRGNLSLIPPDLGPGDIVLFSGLTQNHSSIVAAGTGANALLNFHSNPSYHRPITDLANQPVMHFFRMNRSPGHKKRTRIRQGARVIHESALDEVTADARSFNILTENAANGSEEIEFTLDFSQSVLSVDAKVVGGAGHTVTLTGAFTDITNTRWIGTMSPTQLATLDDGQVTLSVGGQNFAESSSQVDGDPRTVALWGGTGFTRYESETGADGAGGRDTLVNFDIHRNEAPNSLLPRPSVGLPGSGTIKTTQCAMLGGDGSDVCMITVASSDPRTVQVRDPIKRPAWGGPFCGLEAGEHTATITGCNGLSATTTFMVISDESLLSLTASDTDGRSVGQGTPLDRAALATATITVHLSYELERIGSPDFASAVVATIGGDAVPLHVGNNQGNVWADAEWTHSGPVPVSFSIKNTQESGSAPYAGAIGISVGVSGPGVSAQLDKSFSFGYGSPLWNPGDAISGEISVPEGLPRHKCSADRRMCVRTPYHAAKLLCFEPSEEEKQAAHEQGIALSGPICTYTGSALALTTPAQMEMRYKPSPESGTDTATLKLYVWDGTHWQSAEVSNQQFHAEADGTLVLNGETTRSGRYAALFYEPTTLPDAKAPTLSAAAVSDDGVAWQSPDTALLRSTASVRIQAQDLGLGVQLVSGLSTTTAPAPLAAVSGTRVLVHFDEGSGTASADASGYGVDAGLSNGPTWVAGRFGGGVHFNGSNQYASFAQTATFDRTVFSVGIWVKPSAGGLSGNLFSNDNGGSAGYGIGLSGGKPYAYTKAGSPSESFYVQSQVSLAPNQWHYLVMTCDGSRLSLYADGASQGSTPVRINILGVPNPVMGQTGTTGFIVDVDEFRLLDHAQAPEDVLLEYQRGYGAQYSTDGGYSWLPVPPEKLDYGNALEGNPGPYTLTASALPLAESTWTNRIMFYAQDVSGHLSTAVVQVIVPPADVTPLEMDSAEASSDGTAWQAANTLLDGSTVSVRLRIQDPVVGAARTSGVSTTTAALPLAAVSGTRVLVHFDEGSGTTSADASGYGVNAGLAQNPSWVAGRFGNGIHFNGANQYAYFTQSGIFDRTVFSVGIWVKPSATGLSGNLFSNDNGGSAGYGFGLSGGKAYAYTKAGSPSESFYVQSQLSLAPNQWHYLVMTCDGSRLSLYADGASQGSTPVRINILGVPNPVMGQTGTTGFIVDVDEFRLLDHAQAPEDVLLEYQRGYGAQYSTDGGKSWVAVSTAALDYGTAQEGGTGPYSLTVNGLRLAESTTSNRVMFYALDAAAHLSSTTLQVMTAPSDVTAPVLTNPQVSNDGTNWYRYGTVLPGTTAYFRATVQDPAAGIARTSGLSTSTEPVRAALRPLTKMLLRFDEGVGTVSTDESGSGTNATLNGPVWIDGRFGKAVYLDGVNDYITIANNNVINPPSGQPNSITASLWVKIDDPAAGGAIISNWGGAGWQLAMSNGKPDIYIAGPGGDAYISSPEGLSTNVWHHIAATYDGSYVTLYVDGAVKGRKAGPLGFNYGGGVTVGRNNWAWNGYFKGAMDEMRVIAGSAMSAPQIAQEYRRGYGATYSVNSGAAWTRIAQALLDFGGAADGSRQAQILTVSSVPFGVSFSSNLIALSVWDLAGNISTETYAVPIGEDSTPPIPPVLLSAQGRPGGRVELYWGEASGEPNVSYLVYRATESIISAEGRTPIQTGVSTPTFVDAPVDDGLYYYAVAGVDLQGNASPLSNTMSAVVDRSSPVVTGMFPAGGERFAAGRDSLTVSFVVDDAIDSAPTIQSRIVQLADTGNPRGSRPDSVVVSSMQPVDLGLLDDGFWALHVEARDAMGNSTTAWGGVFEVQYDGTPPSAALTNPTTGYVRSATPLIAGTMGDTGSGLSTATLRLILDGSILSAVAQFNGAAGVDLGTWTQATSLQQAVGASGHVIAGGHLYVLGGNPGGALTNVVQHALIMPGGGLGPWQTTTPLPEGRGGARAVYVDGRIFSIGGALNPGSSAVRSAVYAAQVQADGSLGTWISLPPLPLINGLSYFGAYYVNGYIYVIGGYGSSSAYNSVYYARPCAQGLCHPVSGSSSSPWAQTTSLPAARTSFAFASQGSYIYVLGGLDNNYASMSTVWYAFVNGDGTVGAWQTGGALPYAAGTAFAVESQGALYFMGGNNGATYFDSVIAAKIGADHSPGTWQSVRALPKKWGGPVGGVSEGRLYLTAGTAQGVPNAESYSAPMPEGETTSAVLTFAPTLPLAQGSHVVRIEGSDIAGNAASAERTFIVDAVAPAAITDLAMRVLSTGAVELSWSSPGDDGVEGEIADAEFRIQYSSVTSTAFSTASAQIAIHREGLAPRTTFTVLIGGLQSGVRCYASVFTRDTAGNWAGQSNIANDVLLALDTSAPSIGFLNLSDGALLGATITHAAVGYGDAQSGVDVATAFALLDGATIQIQARPDGMDVPVQGFADGWHLLSVWVRDLAGNQATTSVRFRRDVTPPSAALTNPTTGYVRLASPLLSGMMADSGSGLSTTTLHLLLDGTTIVAQTQWNTSSGSGDFGSWLQATSMQQAVGASGHVIAGGHLYVLGGNPGGALTNVVQHALIMPGGGLGPWQTTTPLPEGRGGARAVYVDGRIFSIGGALNPGSSAVRSAVYAAPVQADGSLGTWTSLPPLPLLNGLSYSGALYVNGYIYVIGGYGSSSAYNSVYYARPCAQGLCHPVSGSSSSPWAQTTSLPAARTSFAFASQGSYIYVLGGLDNNYASMSTAWYAFVNGDGTVGAWQTGGALPYAAGTAFAVESQGALYFMGGNNGATYFDSVIAAKIGADHSPGTWQSVRALPKKWGGPVGGVSEGRLYLTAGTAQGVPNAESYHALLPRAEVMDAILSAQLSENLGQGPHVLRLEGADIAGNPAFDERTFIVDVIAPSAVTDFTMSAISSSALTLSWTAPGDDGWTGAIDGAEFRLGYSTIVPAFSTATAQVVLDRAALAPGTTLSWTLENPLLGTTYYAAVFTRDTAGNWSSVSNVATALPMAVASSTDGVVQFVSPEPDATVAIVPVQAEPGAYSVALATQALNPIGNVFYELTSGLVFHDVPARLSFYFDPMLADPSALSIYTFDGMGWSSSSIVNQQVTFLADGRGLLTGEIYHTSLYASMVSDLASPETSFSVDGASSVAAGVVEFVSDSKAVLQAQDRASLGGTPSGVAATYFQIDEGAETPYNGPFWVSVGTHTLAFRSVDGRGNAETMKIVSVRVLLADTTPPTLALVPADRSTVTTAFPLVAASYSDEGRGIDAGTARLSLDGVDVSSSAVVGASSATFTAAVMLAQGRHVAAAEVADLAGNRSSATAAFFIDSLPPETTLLVGGAPFPGGSVVLTSSDSVGFAATDAGVGVARTLYALDGAAPVVFSSAFSVALGTHTLAFHSVDFEGNAEETRLVSLDVLAVDTMTPVLAMQPADGSTVTTVVPSLVVFYSDVGRGMKLTSVRVALDGVDMTAQAVITASSASFTPASALAQGMHTLSAQASDLAGNQASASASFFIDSLPPLTTLRVNGQSVPVGALIIASTDALSFTAIDEGVGIARTLYALDGEAPVEFTTSFSVPSGAHTLAFHSVDKAGSAEATQTVALTVNPATPPTDVPPVRLQVLGNSRMLHHPWDADGRGSRVYIADTNADRILVLGQGGGFLAAYGNVRREEPYFEKPRAVAVDGVGNIFVADTQHHRVVKLGPDGSFLFDIGEARMKKGQKSFHPGSGRAQFRHPSGIALAPGGKIVVSDTGNRRIQVFNADGSFSRVIALPATGERFECDDEDGDRDDDQDESAPFGVDVDAVGSIYVADAKGHRALVFDANGTLRLSVGQKGNAAGSFRRPEGISSTPDGGFFVSDRVLDRISKFDAQGRLSYIFGRHGVIQDRRPLPSEIVFNKPVGLDMDAEGRLYVADRNNERVQVFGPASMAPLVASAVGGFRAASTESAAPSTPEAELPVALAALDAQLAQSARSTVEKDKGGKVLRPDKAAVEVPAAAISDDLEITVAAPAEQVEQSERKDAREQKNLSPASVPVEYGPEGTLFAAPVTITLPYDRDLLLARGVSEDSVKVHYWNPDRKDWEELVTTVDKDALTVSAKTMHFSLYQALAPEGEGLRTALADSEAEFYLRDLYVFPNPARAGAKPTVHLAVGVADSVSIRFYDVSGRKVHEANIDRPPVVMDDGSGPKYVYEYVWDGHIPSGVYFYAVEAKSGGHGSIRRTGKLAVVR
ncbi:MAG: LamG-like jellyroll fold domain-containing protein [Elusimicrobiota bacterium]|jgi:sugar lactone lactonase YvrE